ncbi:MAG TPA: sigma-70 family RNA polymerase sigma factor [Pirellulales bacterium]|jgi:RNA polymerase sigma-70 factor (ECF subfamily)|nr:sigma-70 family RNA polymerase sigma factor [Pirellulales bacterium]
MNDDPAPDDPVELDFNTILWRTQAAIRAFIAGMGAAAHEVDDLAQETYLELYRNLEKIPAGVAPERWLKGIARNVCLNHFRRTARRNRLHREALCELLAAAECGADGLFGRHSMGGMLEDCVGKLPPKQRRLIELRYQQDLSSAAIAEKLDSTAEAIRVLLFRVRGVLKDCVYRTLADQS